MPPSHPFENISRLIDEMVEEKQAGRRAAALRLKTAAAGLPLGSVMMISPNGDVTVCAVEEGDEGEGE